MAGCVNRYRVAGVEGGSRAPEGDSAAGEGNGVRGTADRDSTRGSCSGAGE